MNQQSLSIPITVIEGQKSVGTHTTGLIDCRAGGIFIDKTFVKENNIKTTPLQKHIPVRNVDGTLNQAGSITDCVWTKIRIGGEEFGIRLLVSGLGKESIILGLPWLKRHNPKIDWEKGTLDFGPSMRKGVLSEAIRKHIEIRQIKRNPKATIEETNELYPEEQPRNLPLSENEPILIGLDDEEDIGLLRAYIYPDEEDEEIWIRAKTSISQGLEHKTEEQKPKTVLLEFYKEYALVFDKETSERMPMKLPWDHAIELKEDFIPKDCKLYPISPAEQEHLNEFINENL